MVEENVDNALCIFIFKEGHLTKDESKSLSTLMQQYIDNRHIPYDMITNKVYELSDEGVNNLIQSIEEKLSALIFEGDKSKKINRIQNDIIRHIRLSVIQRKFIIKSAEQAKEISTQAKDVAQEANNIKDKIYTDFISILGIFTAISFTIFGGLQLLGNVFSRGIGADGKFIGSALIIGSFFILSIYILLVVLINGIRSIMGSLDKKTGKNYSYLFVPMFCLVVFAIGLCFIKHN